MLARSAALDDESTALPFMNPIVRLITRALVAVLMLASGGCRDRAGVLATVLAVKGEVTATDAASARVRPGAVLAPPSEIRTGSDGAVVVSPLPGIMIRLEAGGEISIDAIELRKRGEEIEARVCRVELRHGRARVWVDEFRRGRLDLQLRTASGEMVFHGPALAEVAVERGGAVRAICVDGAFSAAGTTLTAGRWLAVVPREVQPQSQEAADTDEIWKMLLEVRGLEPQFLDLQARQRERTPNRAAATPELAPEK
jgi:hypothetical protein